MSTIEATDAVSTVEDVVIVDTVRSPLGRCGPGGALAGVRPAVLLTQVAQALLDRTGLDPAAVTNTLISGGPGFDDVARETCSLIGVVPRPLVPLEPGSSQQSIIHAAAREVGRHDVVLVLATTVPNPPAPSHGLSRRGISAELVASRWKLGRDEVDAYARRSRWRAREVAAMGEFGPETVPVAAWSRDSCTIIASDETIAGDPPPVTGAPLFYEPAIAKQYPEIGWHLHAGNVSQPATGAAAAILAGSDRAIELGRRPRARILALAECAHTPGSQLCGPIRAARAVLEHTGIDPDKLDHYEISEAFPSIPLAWQREFDADTDRLNPRGGSIGLGHPGPAAGLRSLATTLSALEATGGRLSIQASEGIGSGGDALLLQLLPRPTHSGPDRSPAWTEATGRTGATP
jgi:acetyl-CoA acyltransferase